MWLHVNKSIMHGSLLPTYVHAKNLPENLKTVEKHRKVGCLSVDHDTVSRFLFFLPSFIDLNQPALLSTEGF